MGHAARAELESLLRARQLDVTLTSAAPWAGVHRDVAPTGIAALDAALGGGLARGHLSEIVGARSSGRHDGAVPDAGGRGGARRSGGAHRHVRSLRSGVGGRRPASTCRSCCGCATRATRHARLKAMNLVLQAGGFGVVAFDLADVPPMALRQFPYTTWMRIARVIEGSQTAAVLVGAERLARSPGGVTIALEAHARDAGRAPRIARGCCARSIRVRGSWGGDAEALQEVRRSGDSFLKTNRLLISSISC